MIRKIGFLLLIGQICVRSIGQDPKLIIPTGHVLGVRHCSFKSDGKYFITTGYDCTARIHEMQSGRNIMTFQEVSYAEFSPNGKLVLTVGIDSAVRIYSFSNGKEICTLKGDTGSILTAVFSSDGKQVLTSCDDGNSRIFNLSDGNDQMLLKARIAASSIDGKLILISGDTAKIYDLYKKKEMTTLSLVHDENFEGSYLESAFSPDGKLAVITDYTRHAWFFDVASGKLMYQKEGVGYSPYGVFTLEFSPDAKFFIHTQDAFEMIGAGRNNSDSTYLISAEISIYQASSGQRIKEIVTNAQRIRSACCSPDGRLLLTQTDSLVRIFDATSGNEILDWGIDFPHWGPDFHSNASRESAFFSPDGKWIVVKGMDDVLVYDAHDGREMYRLVGQLGEVEGCYFTSDGNHVITSLENGDCEVREFLSDRVVQDYSSLRVTFSADRKLLIQFNESGEAILKETITGRTLASFAGVQNAEFSSNGLFILIVGLDNKVRVFSMATGVEIDKFTHYENEVVNASISPDGHFLFVEFVIPGLLDGGEIDDFTKYFGVTFDVQTGEEYSISQESIHRESRYDNGEIESNSTKLYSFGGGSLDQTFFSSFSPKGDKLLKISAYQTSIYNLVTDTTVEFPSTFKFAVFSPDGNYILARTENFASLIESTSGVEVQKYAEKYGGVDYIQFSPDGEKILVSCKAGVIIYEALTGKQLHVLKGHLCILNRELSWLGYENYLTLTSADFSSDGRYMVTTGYDNKIIFWDLATGNRLFTRMQFINDDWLVYDDYFLFDGSADIQDNIFIKGGSNVLEIGKFNQDLHVPGLVGKILRGEVIQQRKFIK